MEMIKKIGGLLETTIGPIDNLGKNVNKVTFFSNDLDEFLDENGNKVEEKTLTSWACSLNPSKHASLQKIKYFITSPNEKGVLCDEKWCCLYRSEWAHGTVAIIMGYGNTEIDALQNCKGNLALVQARFNPNDISL